VAVLAGVEAGRSVSPGESLDWHALTVHLADRGKGSVVLDRNRTIRLFSSPLEQLLGWPRDAVEGRDWAEALVPPAHRRAAAARIDRALSGALPAFESVTRARCERMFTLSFDSALVGPRDCQGLLLTVVGAQPVTSEDPAGVGEMEYEISTAAGTFGVLHALRTLGGTVARLDSRTPCYRALHGRDVPCSDCPAVGLTQSTSRTVTRRIDSRPEAYEVVAATALEEGRARVRLQRVSDDVVGSIQEARIRALGDRARLTERERLVLWYTLRGRSIAEIARILEISPRTVKFHHANVLDKVGAESRTDLFRLVF
jgi:PAS domain S-box-containing protein